MFLTVTGKGIRMGHFLHKGIYRPCAAAWYGWLLFLQAHAAHL